MNGPFSPMTSTFARNLTPPATKWGVRPVYPDETDFCKKFNTPQRALTPPISFYLEGNHGHV